MSYENRDSGCGLVAAVLLVLVLGLCVLGVLMGIFFAKTAAKEEAILARDAAVVAQQQAQAMPPQKLSPSAAEADPVSVVTIEVGVEGGISFEGEPIDFEGLRPRLSNAKSSQFFLKVDRACRFEHVSTVLAEFDKAGSLFVYWRAL